MALNECCYLRASSDCAKLHALHKTEGRPQVVDHDAQVRSRQCSMALHSDIQTAAKRRRATAGPEPGHKRHAKLETLRPE